MLKKFLKFLKGASSERQFDGSYLEHLLEQAEPRVEGQLAECPQHDPLLLVVAEILRLTKPEYWSARIDCPLADEQSPALAESSAAPPPPEPPQPPATPEELSDDFEIVEAEDAATYAAEDVGEAATQADDSDEEPGDVDEAEPPDARAGEDLDESPDDESPDDESPDDESPDDESPDGEAAAESEVESEAEPEVETSEETEQDTQEETEKESEQAPVDEPEELLAEDERTRLDAPEVLQAGRIFLGLLIENDRLPLDMQLTVAETMLARDLLLGYFVQDDAFDNKAKELLALVEQKFNEGAFSQARILLQLFQTDRSTRINNDRNLFYEEMILRLGIRRRHPLDHTLLDEFSAVADGEDLDDSLVRTTGWLDQNLHVVFHLFTRHPEQVARWRSLAERSEREHAPQVFLRYLPPKRWRPVHSKGRAPSELVTAHISAATVKAYVVRQLKACYFVLRAVGDTGLEPFLDSFFEWTERCFGLNSVRLMPLIYRRTMANTQLVDKIFEEIFRNFFRSRAAEHLDGFGDDAILEATRETLDAIAALDFNELPPGNFDLGGLVLDRLFGIEYHEPQFAFKLHRLT
ncbi:MAG: hypothetical protein ACOC9J_04885 [Persicimonas sp.]